MFFIKLAKPNGIKISLVFFKNLFCNVIIYITFFNSTLVAQLSVKEAINKCLDNNKYLKAYTLTPEIEKFDSQTAAYRPNPILNNQSIFMIHQKNLDAIKPNQTLFTSMYGNQLWFQATKPLQIGGKRKQKINVQKQEYELSKLDLQQFTYNLAYKTAQQWLEVWFADEILQNNQIAKINIDSIYEANQIRLKRKEITASDVSRALVLSEKHATEVNIAWQNWNSQLAKFKILTGNNADDINYESSFFFVEVASSDSILINKAKQNRIDLKMVVQNQNINNANTKWQKSMAVPNMEVGVIANPQNTQPYLGWYFQMPIPLLDRNKANISKSKTEGLQSQLEAEALIQEIESQITISWQEYQIYKTNFEQFKTIRNNSTAILKSIKTDYLEGKTTIVDYLNAKQTWNDTEHEYDIAEYKYRKSYLDLLYLSGNLLQ